MSIERAQGSLPRGPWSFASWRPPDLPAYVDHVWAYTGPTSHPRKRVFPNGCIELLLNFGAPYRLIEGSGTDVRRSAWVGGPQTGPLIVQQPPCQHVMGVRLRPAGALALLARPLREVTDLAVDLRDLVGPAADELAERCAETDVADARFGLVADWLRARLADAPAMDRAVAWAVGQIDAQGGAVSIAALRREIGWSETRLVGVFRDQVGLGPKLYARVARFRRALALLQRARECRLTDVALDAAFYDQPHMNAEFRALGGITPREFLAARHPVGDGSTASDGPPAR